MISQTVIYVYSHYYRLLKIGLFNVVVVMAVFAAPVVASDDKHPDNDVVKMKAFVSTGTRTLQSADTTPVRVEIAMANESTRLGAMSFADSMEYIPGVQVESNCQNCNTTEIRLLGLGGAYNQIAFDGLPMLSSLAGVYGVEQVPAAFIERIEVVKGGGSSLYGANAVAGVINIIPQRPRESGQTLDYRYESTHRATAHQIGFVSNVVGSRLTFSAYGQAIQVQELDLNGDEFTERTRRRMQVAGLRLQSTTTRLVVAADLNFTHEYRRGGNYLDRPAHLSNITEQLDTRRTAATFTLESKDHTQFDYKIVLAGAWTHRESYYGGLGDVITDRHAPNYDPTAYQEALALSENQYATTDNPLYVFDAQFNYYRNNQTLSWGLQGEYEEIDDRNISAAGIPTQGPALVDDFSNLAVFGQHEWTPLDTWTLLWGVRLDKNDQLDQAILSPRISLRYSPSKYLTLRGSLSTGFRAPRIFDEDLHINTLGAEPIAIVNAPGLKKESAIAGNLGGVWNPRPWSDVLAFEFNGYLTYLQDAFQLSPIRTHSNGDLVQERFNSGTVRGYSIEFNTAYSFSPKLRTDLGLVWQRTRHNDPVELFDDGAGQVIKTTRFNKTPDRFAVLQLQYENPEGIDWAVGIRHIGSMRVLNNTTGTFDKTSTFTLYDFSIGQHFTWGGSEAQIRLGVRNLTDDRQQDYESGAMRDSTYVYGPRQPRSYFSSLRINF